MAYHATILNVMIASPSDVTEERKLVRDAIYEWNAIHSKQFGIMLNPIGWETHVAPEMGARPQEIINKRILEHSDILLGIFWTRLGTETGEYVSGTVEEISRHIASQKLASIYVCDKPIPPSQITEQYQKLKLQITEWMPSGVIEFYNDLSTFKQKIKDHLSLHVQQNEYIKKSIRDITTNIEIDKNIIPIPTEAKKLLTNALKENGTILNLRYHDGTTEFSAGSFKYNSDNARDIAKWQAGLKYLIDNQLVVDINNKGEIFELTQFGWELSEVS